MRSKKFILLVVVILLLLSQAPFAYRRYKLRRLSANIQQLNSLRHSPEPAGFRDYKGVVHVHSFLGGHSSGTFTEIISAAQANELQFVVMTEHTEKDFDTAAMTLKGMHGGVLFVNGNEVSTANGDRLLMLPENIAIAAYPDDFKNWETPDLSGVEVYNVYTNAKRISPVVAFFDALWSHRAYPDLMFAFYLARPDEGLWKWDQALTKSKLAALAGNDAHANIGVSLKDSAGKTLLGIQLDPYATSFRLVRMHALIQKDRAFDEAGLLDALRAGHCFIGFDFLGDSSGFSFSATNGQERRIQGDEISLTQDTRLHVETPVPSRVVIYKNGTVFTMEREVTSKDFPIYEPGVYRAEVYLPQLGSIVGNQPWIISNPIYVR